MASLAMALAPHKTLLSQMHQRFADAIPTTAKRVMTPERITTIMLSAMSRNPRLAECTPESILKVCLVAAELGLEPHSPLGHLYAVPFRNRGRMEATPIIGYQGFITLARRSGQITQIDAHVVYEADKFVVRYGLEPALEHEPSFATDRGSIIAAYCVATFTDGGKHLEVMTRAELDAIRSRSRAKDSGPWVTDTAEMYRKTVVRRASKYWPLSTEFSRMLEVDNQDYAPPQAEVHDAPEPLQNKSHTDRLLEQISDVEETDDLGDDPNGWRAAEREIAEQETETQCAE